MYDKCGICREELIDNIKNLECNHTFHIDCINSWAKISNVCPFCRIEIYSNVDLIRLGLSEERIFNILTENEISMSDIKSLIQSKHIPDIVIKILLHKKFFTINIINSLINENVFNDHILKHILIMNILPKYMIMKFIMNKKFDENVITFILDNCLLSVYNIIHLITKKVLTSDILKYILNLKLLTVSDINNLIYNNIFDIDILIHIFKFNYSDIEYLIDFIRDGHIDRSIIKHFNFGYFSDYKIKRYINNHLLNNKVIVSYLSKKDTEFIVLRIIKNKRLHDIKHYIPPHIIRKIIFEIQSYLTDNDIVYLYDNNNLVKEDLYKIIDKHDETKYTQSIKYLENNK